MTDEDLVRAALEGSESAYTELYARLLPKMRRVAYRYLRDEDAGHDFVAFIFSKMNQFKFESKFSTWATRIAMNQACMVLRRMKATTRMPRGGIVSLTAAPAMQDGVAAIQVEDPRGLHEQMDARADVEDILSRLPAGYRRVLKARFFDGMTHEEAADKFGVTTGCTKSQQRKGLQRARQVMEEMGAR